MSQRTWRNKADRLFSIIVRSRGRCERCGAEPPAVKLETSHVFSRRYAWTRVDERNAFCLCSSCHRYVTANPTEHARFAFEQWMRLYGPGVESDLLALRERGKRPADFWQREYERLVTAAAISNIDI